MNCPSSVKESRGYFSWQTNSLTFQTTQLKSLLDIRSVQKHMISNLVDKKAFASIDLIIELVPEWFAIKFFEIWVLQKSPNQCNGSSSWNMLTFFLFQGEWGEIWKMHALWFETWILNRSASPESESGDMGANQLGKPWMKSWIADAHAGLYDYPLADTADIQTHVSRGTWLGEQWMNSWISDSDAQELDKQL